MKGTHLLTVTVAGLLVLALTSPALADDSWSESYHKHMARYYSHLEEAREEAEEGDWDDYREEMEKAQRDLDKAQQYAARDSGFRDFDERVEIVRPRESWGGFRGFHGRVDIGGPRRFPGSRYGWYSREPAHRHGRWNQRRSRSHRGHRSSGGIRFSFGSGGFRIGFGGGGRRRH